MFYLVALLCASFLNSITDPRLNNGSLLQENHRNAHFRCTSNIASLLAIAIKFVENSFRLLEIILNSVLTRCIFQQRDITILSN